MKLPDEIELKISKDELVYKERFTTKAPERIKLTKMVMDRFKAQVPEESLIDTGEDWISITVKKPSNISIISILGSIATEMNLPSDEKLILIGCITGSALFVRQFDTKIQHDFDEIIETKEGKELLESMLKRANETNK